MAQQRSEQTRKKILAAAEVEFSQSGLDGVRLDAVAERAGVNRALIYRYYGDKNGLFEAVLARKFEARTKLTEHLPDSISEMFAFWSVKARENPEMLRLFQQEALSDAPVMAAETRREYMTKQAEVIRAAQDKHEVPASLDPEITFLAMHALVNFPVSFPKAVKLMTGQQATSEAFQARWLAFLQSYAGMMADAAKATDVEGD